MVRRIATAPPSPPNTAALAATGLGVALGRQQIISDFDLAVDAATWTTIIGPNGAGKSTLLRALAGVIESTGHISAATGTSNGGTPNRADVRDRRAWTQLVGYLPQHPVVPPGVRVIDYVMLGRVPHHGAFGSPGPRDLARVESMLQLFDLRSLADRPIASISGGEAQRAALARVMAQDAAVLLLDEPTTGLDIGHQQELLDLLDDVRRDRDVTVITTMHDLTVAGRHADRLVMIDRGNVVFAGPAAEVLTPTRIFATYRARVQVLDHGDGPVVVPEPRHHTATTTRSYTAMAEATTPDTPDTPPEVDPRPKLTNAQSLVIVNTGNGKGKSSSAFGMMCRGVARGWNVAVIQYLKSGSWSVGEEKVGRQLGVDWWALGEGFTWDSEDLSVDQAVAAEAWKHAKATIEAGEHELVILDEITYVMNWGWIDADDVLATIAGRPPKVSIICTGRDASDALIDLADTVTEMRHVKHAYDSGIAAKRGLDY